MRGRGVHIGFWWKKPRGTRTLGRPRNRLNDNIIIIIIIIIVWGLWTGFIRLRIGTSGELL
jgi:hypothetical protein